MFSSIGFVLLIPPLVLADNQTDTSDPIFDLSDGWSIAALAMLGVLGLLILARVVTTFVTVEVQDVERTESPVA